ncbi:hypothetical protein B5807_02937 [Epicoccum nigrum]|uniref:Uncharacterized protein n=1 Tax=Epicoccum nigrum TaxID=105696 RepID=A0A1Y2MA99_EPING|nr:hypothetical protein B5807_02937 [Epicoccum nigrum]
MTSPTKPYFTTSIEIADLGAARFDQDVAAIGDKDYALIRPGQPVAVQAGRAPKGLESQVFAWNTFQYTTEERNEKEEKKGDLHEGQLHRANRAASGGGQIMGYDSRPPNYGNAGGMRGGFGSGRGGMRGGAGGPGGPGGGQMGALCAGRKPAVHAPPLAKGFAEELDKSLFWDEPIC